MGKLATGILEAIGVPEEAPLVQDEQPIQVGEPVDPPKTFLDHAKKWVTDRELLRKDSDYDGMLGRAVLRMAELFSSEGHSGMSARFARAYFNWLCDAYDGLHTLMLNDEDYEKAKKVLEMEAVEVIEGIISIGTLYEGTLFEMSLGDKVNFETFYKAKAKFVTARTALLLALTKMEGDARLDDSPEVANLIKRAEDVFHRRVADALMRLTDDMDSAAEEYRVASERQK